MYNDDGRQQSSSQKLHFETGWVSALRKENVFGEDYAIRRREAH
jgi:hypothetical protein